MSGLSVFNWGHCIARLTALTNISGFVSSADLFFQSQSPQHWQTEGCFLDRLTFLTPTIYGPVLVFTWSLLILNIKHRPITNQTKSHVVRNFWHEKWYLWCRQAYNEIWISQLCICFKSLSFQISIYYFKLVFLIYMR